MFILTNRTVSAFAAMIATLVGTALGPYLTGYLSDMQFKAGVESGEALRRAMLWSLVFPVMGIGLITRALHYIETDEQSVKQRSHNLGEIF